MYMLLACYSILPAMAAVKVHTSSGRAKVEHTGACDPATSPTNSGVSVTVDSLASHTQHESLSVSRRY